MRMGVTSKPARKTHSTFDSSPMEESFLNVQSDVIISVDGVEFSLHKFPLMARSGRIRKLLAENLPKEAPDFSPVLEFSGFPGGADIFELTAKFCYGIDTEITTANVGHLRCAAEVLEMTENFGTGNLVARSEAYLNEVVFKSIDSSVEVLHFCEPILNLAEEFRIVNRCIDAIAFNISNEQQKLCNLMRMDGNNSGRWNIGACELVHATGIQATVEWWADSLSSLRIDLYQRAFAAMKARGLKVESLGGSLMHYAHHALKGLTIPGSKEVGVSAFMGLRTKTKTQAAVSPVGLEHEQRVMLETLVSLLPSEKNLFPTGFLLWLLHIAVHLDTTVACWLDLEHRIGLQLEHASVVDLLIPTCSNARDTMYDVDIVQRILATYLQEGEEKTDQQHSFHLESTPIDDVNDGYISPQKSMTKVAKLMDLYFTEIASDPNLKVSKFISLTEQLPGNARLLDDGLYRAIDIFLKAHPTISDIERQRLCKVLDCQKLSKEACTHAAQNERLPVQFVVQILYFEQIRMKNAIGGSMLEDDGHVGSYASRQLFKTSGLTPPKLENTSSLKQENRQLKQEIAKLQMRVAELEKENSALRQESEKPEPNGGHGSSHKFFSSFSRRLGWMNPFSATRHKDTLKNLGTKAPPRQRRHSVS